MTPAQLHYLRDVARKLEAAPASGGERGRIVTLKRTLYRSTQP